MKTGQIEYFKVVGLVVTAPGLCGYDSKCMRPLGGSFATLHHFGEDLDKRNLIEINEDLEIHGVVNSSLHLDGKT